jgi:hypothetical protein
MFSLRFDLLFPTLQAAKDLARKLNKPHLPHPNPRELKRMQDELRLARDKVRAETMLWQRRGL